MFESSETYDPASDSFSAVTRPIRGANQFLGHQAAHHDGESTLAPGGNRVQSGRVPRTSSSRAGKPDAANPLGRGSSKSLQG